MNNHLNKLIEEQGEASGIDLMDALFQENIDRLTDSALAQVRHLMASNPETEHLAKHLDLQEDNEFNENAHLIYNLSYSPLRGRIERFMAHVIKQSLERQLRFAKNDTRHKLNALVREELDDLDF